MQMQKHVYVYLNQTAPTGTQLLEPPGCTFNVRNYFNVNVEFLVYKANRILKFVNN